MGGSYTTYAQATVAGRRFMLIGHELVCRGACSKCLHAIEFDAAREAPRWLSARDDIFPPLLVAQASFPEALAAFCSQFAALVAAREAEALGSDIHKSDEAREKAARRL